MSKPAAITTIADTKKSNASWSNSQAMRWLMVFTQFVFLGPPIGCIAFLVFWPTYHILAVFAFRTFGLVIEPEFYNNYIHDGFFQHLGTLPLILFFGFFMSYIFGGLQAVICGVVSATWNYWFKTLPLHVTLLASVLPYSVFLMLKPDRLVGKSIMADSDPKKIPYLLALIAFTHLCPAFVCWFRTRRYFNKRNIEK
ncbi:MAG: hypothetical protein ABI230_01100 [Aestuariivirga sp.]